MPISTSPSFTKVIIETGGDGRSYFREEELPLDAGNELLALSALLPSQSVQFRMSPVGYSSNFHCSPQRQWMFVLRGSITIGLQDGTCRTFHAGDHLYSDDILPDGATFDPAHHGHSSHQEGDEPLYTMFIRD